MDCIRGEDHDWRPRGRSTAGKRRIYCPRCEEGGWLAPDGQVVTGQQRPPVDRVAFWTELARSLPGNGLVKGFADLKRTYEAPGVRPRTLSVWLNQTPLEDIRTEEVDPDLHDLLLAAVDRYRDTAHQIPRQRDVDVLVPIPMGGAVLELSSAIWGALGGARSVATAFRGIPFPTWLDEHAAEMAGPWRRLLGPAEPDADRQVDPTLQYWVTWEANVLTAFVGLGRRCIGVSRAALPSDNDLQYPHQPFKARLLPRASKWRDGFPPSISLPLYGYAGSGLTLVSRSRGARE
jgi:hypothetical protein